MKIFMTGTTGFIGNMLLHALLRDGHEISTLIRNSSNKSLVALPGVSLHYGDLRDQEAVNSAMKDCRQVYHLAGYARLWSGNSDTVFAVNVKGTHNILTAAAGNDIEKLVYTSSAGVLGESLREPLRESDPRINALTNDYDISKHMAEELVRSFSDNGLHAVIVNPTRVYGPGPLSHSNAISRLLQQFMNSTISWVPGCGQVVANYAFIDDVVKGHQLAMEHGISGERYILGGENISYTGLYQIIEELTGKKVSRRIPVWLMKGAGYLQLMNYYLSGKEPEFTPETLQRLFRNAALSNEKAIQELGYRVTPLKSGLKQTIDNLKLQHYD